MEHRTNTYMIEYNMDGSRWVIDVKADSPADAMRRLGQASAFGRVLNETGEVWSSPVATGWWVPLWVMWKNLLAK